MRCLLRLSLVDMPSQLSILTIWSSFRLSSRLLLKPNLLLFFRSAKVLATMLTRLFSAIWQRVLFSMLRSSVGRILRSFFTSITVTASSFARAV